MHIYIYIYIHIQTHIPLNGGILIATVKPSKHTRLCCLPFSSATKHLPLVVQESQSTLHIHTWRYCQCILQSGEHGKVKMTMTSGHSFRGNRERQKQVIRGNTDRGSGWQTGGIWMQVAGCWEGVSVGWGWGRDWAWIIWWGGGDAMLQLRVVRVRVGRCCSSCWGLMCITLPVYWPPETFSSGAGPGGWGCGPLWFRSSPVQLLATVCSLSSP